MTTETEVKTTEHLKTVLATKLTTAKQIEKALLKARREWGRSGSAASLMRLEAIEGLKAEIQ